VDELMQESVEELDTDSRERTGTEKAMLQQMIKMITVMARQMEKMEKDNAELRRRSWTLRPSQ